MKAVVLSRRRWTPAAQPNRWISTAFAVALVATLAAPSRTFAWSAACNTSSEVSHGVAQNEAHTGVIGAQAIIEWFNDALCTNANPSTVSLSSAWVALEGSSALDIYQVGFDKCQQAGCSQGNPAGTSFYFLAYGRNGNATCPGQVLPLAQEAPKGLAGAGSLTYSVVKEPDPDHPSQYKYFASIDGVVQGSQTTTAIEGCWGGVVQGQYADEVYDYGDQTGGTVRNHQGFTYVRWHDATYWRAMNRVYSSPCDVINDPTNEHCNVASNHHDWFFSWDARAP